MVDETKGSNTPAPTPEQIAAKAREEALAEAKAQYDKSLEELRKRDEREREKAKMSIEEKAKADAKDELEAEKAKNARYEERIKQSEIKEALNANKLPARYQYDSRLINSTPENRAEIVKQLVKEFGDETATYKASGNAGTAPAISATGQVSAEAKTLEEIKKMSTEQYMEWRRKNSL